MHDGERVLIPRLTTASSRRWPVGTVIGLATMLGWVAATQPQHRTGVAAGTALLVPGLLWVATRRIWIEPATGTVVREVFRCWRRRTALPTATIDLVDNGAGALLLAVTRGRTIYLPLLAATDYVRRSQAPEVLRFLAAQLDRHVPRVHGIAVQLRRQADDVARQPEAPQDRTGRAACSRPARVGYPLSSIR